MDQWLPQLLADYGYVAVFVGALLEGESLLLIAAYAAHRGYLSLPLVIGVAVVGATLGDQFFFVMGRRFGWLLIARSPGLLRRVERVERLLLRYPGAIVIAVRFAYGLRIAGPIAIGMSELPAQRFLLFNALGALIWAPLVAGVGYLFGHAVEQLLGDLRQYELAGVILFAFLVVISSIVSHLVRGRGARGGKDGR